MGLSGSVEGGRNLSYGEVRDSGSRISGCLEPDIAVSLLEELNVHGTLLL